MIRASVRLLDVDPHDRPMENYHGLQHAVVHHYGRCPAVVSKGRDGQRRLIPPGLFYPQQSLMEEWCTALFGNPVDVNTGHHRWTMRDGLWVFDSAAKAQKFADRWGSLSYTGVMLVMSDSGPIWEYAHQRGFSRIYTNIFMNFKGSWDRIEDMLNPHFVDYLRDLFPAHRMPEFQLMDIERLRVSAAAMVMHFPQASDAVLLKLSLE